MAFVVEDGTGLPDATSLVSVEYANSYFSTFGNDDWATLDEPIKQVRLNRGTQATCTFYAFRGVRRLNNQALCFPRIGVSDPSGQAVFGIPTCVMQAVCEFAVRAVTSTTLFPDPTFDSNGRAIKRIKQQAGPLQQEIEYAGPGDLVHESRFPSIDAIMCAWLIVPRTDSRNGVVIAPAVVTGVSVSQMAEVQSNPDRYRGPMDEGGEDSDPTGRSVENPKRGIQP